MSGCLSVSGLSGRLMIRTRLFELLQNVNETSSLDTESNQKIKRATLLYCMGRRNSADFRMLGKDLGIVEPLFNFKSSFLDRTHYTISLYWRAAFAYFRYLDCKPAGPDEIWVDQATVHKAIKHVPQLNTPELRDGCDHDLHLMEDCLDVEDQRSLFRLSRSAHYRDLDSQDFYSLTKDLQRYAAGITYHNARFLTRNDYGLSLTDLQNEVFEAGLRTMYQYDSDDDMLRLLNTAKRGAYNHMIIMLEHHTAKRRRRLARVTEPPKPTTKACGTCDWFDCKVNGESCRDKNVLPSQRRCTSGHRYKAHKYTEEEICVNCQFYDEKHSMVKNPCAKMDQDPKARPCMAFELKATQLGEYSQTLTSLDSPVKGYEDTAMIDLLETDQVTQEQEMSRQEWLQSFYNASDGDLKRITNILLGEADSEFERWLHDRTGKSPDDLQKTALARQACKFMGITIGQLRQDVQTVAA